METLDPATGQPLPADAIQRVLFVANSVHVYNIPPLTSTKGYQAASWTADGNSRQIFTARVRVVETAFEEGDGDGDGDAGGPSATAERLKVDVVLEDASTGQLFAAAPYVDADVVEPVLDSSRFFALRVRDDAGRKAVLGIGFEERGESFDFGVALQEARKALGFDSAGGGGGAGGGSAGGGAGKGYSLTGAASAPEEKRDYSLKDGETITVNLGGTKFGRRARPQEASSSAPPTNLNAFALPPPPSASTSKSGGGGFSLPPPPPAAGSRSSGGVGGGGGGSFSLAPPPSAPESGARQQRTQRASAKDLGFDDGQFGEFA